MDLFWGMTSTAWTGIYTIITFAYTIITLGIFVVAAVAALYAKKQWQNAREQADDSRSAQVEASRPYVIVAIEPSRAGPQLFDLAVRNIGRRPAFSVSISLDPPPKRSRETDGHEMANAKMLSEPIAMIAPGQEMRAFYDSRIERNGRDDLPTSHQVALNYNDSSGRPYLDTSILDIEAMKGTMYASVHTLHDIGKTLEEMQRTLSRASLLRESGSVDVDASIESRSERTQRLVAEETEWAEQYRRVQMQLRSGGSSVENRGSDPAGGEDGGGGQGPSGS